MKPLKVISFFLFVFMISSFCFNAYAPYVNGYYRSDGTYVRGHYRSNPDGVKWNNYGPSKNSS